MCSVETCIAFGKFQWEVVTIISESENVVSKILLNVLQSMKRGILCELILAFK